MYTYLNLGPTPCDEDCAQVGSENYSVRARAECKRFIDLLIKTFGKEPKGAKLSIKTFPHDFGTYHEVVCFFDDRNEKATDYAYDCESRAPTRWEEE